jgi:2-dehydropantoate 2-reductase
VGPRTLVLPTQNGVDTPARLATLLGSAEPVLGGYTRVTSLLTAPGHVSHIAVHPVLQGAGLLPSTGSWAAEELRRCSAAFEGCPHIKLCVEADIQRGMWRKLIILATFSTVCCVSRCPLGPLMEAEASREVIQQCMTECASVAKACGSEMSAEDVESCLAQLQRLPYGCTPSLMRDYIDGRPSELHSQTGAVVRLGREHGVPTPLLAAMYALLLPNELRNRGKLSWPDITDE